MPALVKEGSYQQSAALPYLIQPDGLKIVLITSRKRHRWIIPKGAIEPHLTAWDSAAQEAWEEAGIEGVITTEPLGIYRHQKWEGSSMVQVFPLAVTRLHQQWLEDQERQRRVVSVAKALKLIEMKALRRMVSQLEVWLNLSPCES
ncbi:NUDIX hydrolase [Acaryochloris sp. IP29b_bin.148]|uniref:NUDIX hydrolase n=1 Tax=Acaryochloris sp. IP29b_bin.148 TaxID=2969218 RepID=UPI0026285A9E|nr:NUDIX hydrolase [Acaryochloris sp. IP29b_bin.148]